MSNITIRDIHPDDLAVLTTLLQQLWPGKDISPASLKDSFSKSFSPQGPIIRCACYQNLVVGICTLSIRNNLKAEGNLANIDELVVDENMRGRGIGQLLLKDAEAIARGNGCKSLGLESSFHREDAHRFYIKNGYEKQGYYMIRKLEVPPCGSE